MIDDTNFASVLSLCRFHLNADEEARFRAEIGDILAYMEKLTSLDTSSIDVNLGQAREPENLRDDTAASGVTTDRLEALSPFFKDGLFLTPPILEELEEIDRGSS